MIAIAGTIGTGTYKLADIWIAIRSRLISGVHRAFPGFWLSPGGASHPS